MEEITHLREYIELKKKSELKLKVLDWLSIVCLAGAIISFALEVIYGGEFYGNQTLGFIVAWLTINEIRMREGFNSTRELTNVRFDSMRELITSRFDNLENRLERIEKKR
ncbi:MAG: hypothetical protein QMD22_02015 [archaeon]|nr:hypothetical protein [archaeon]